MEPVTDARQYREMQSRSYTGLPAVLGEMNGNPVHAYGRMFVYGISPDFRSDVVLQHDNLNGRAKVVPKKSWEIQENFLGSMISYQPRTPQSDFQPFLSVHLIDGDPQTSWCSRGEIQPDVAPAWIRLDLAVEENLQEIALVPRKDGQELPAELTIQVSCDAWHWTTVYDSRGTAPPSTEPLRVRLECSIRAKQIWIKANQLPLEKILGTDRSFSLAQVKALDEHGEDVALLSRGTGVTVSSTNYGFGSAWDYYDLMWPTQYDLGAKWMRLSGGNSPNDYDTLQWRFVEQKRGQYVMDERTTRAIREAAGNGYKIVVILTYGNWLYAAEPEKANLDARAFPTPFPPAPVTRESIEGYKNWVRFMAEHFRGCIAYWEIYNEAEYFGYQAIEDEYERMRVYCDLVKEVVPIIRKADPDAKIGLAGRAGVMCLTSFGEERPDKSKEWLYQCLDQGVAPLVDALGWHIQQNIHPGLPGWDLYPKLVRELKEEAEAKGFRGVYMASEYWLGDPYPPHPLWGYPPHINTSDGPPMTEIRKAKDMARTYLLNLGLGVIPFFCNTWLETFQVGNGLFRNTFAADPLSPAQPGAGYYVMRTLCTVMDQATPAHLPVCFSEQEHKTENWSFSLPNGAFLAALWLPGASVDRHPGVTTDVTVDVARCSRVTGIDTLNGFEEELRFEQQDGQVVISDLIIRDYPLVVRLETA